MYDNTTFRCLRAALVEWRPHIIMAGNNRSGLILSGSQLAVNDIIMQKLGTCIEYIIPEDSTFGNRMKNGSWTGAMGLLARGDVDLSGVLLSMDYARNSDIDFSIPLYSDEFIIAYRRPIMESDLAGFVKPFSSLLWGLFLGSMCLVTAALLLIQMGHLSLHGRPRNSFNSKGERNAGEEQPFVEDKLVWNSVSWSLGAFLSQSCPWWPEKNSVRIISSLWLMAAFIIGTLYKSTLKAMLILPKVELPFNTMNELLESGIYTFVTEGSMLHQAVKEAPEGSNLNLMSKRMITHTDSLRVMRDLNAGAYAVPIGSFSIYYAMHATYSSTKKCPIYIAEERFFGGTALAMGFPKGSLLRKDVNFVIRSLLESGILNHIFLKHLRYAQVCLKVDPRKPADNSQRPMDLQSFYGVFIVYAGGIILSILAFILEVAMKLSKKKTTTIPEIAVGQ